MAPSLLTIALLSTAALAAPRPEVEVVQVRELVRRQDPTDLDLSDLLPTGVDLDDLASLLPTGSIDLSSIIGDIATLLPSDIMGCLPPTDLPAAPTIPADVASVVVTHTDFCNEPKFTGSVSEHWDSYLSEASKYADENGEQITSWINALSTDCPYASLIPTDASQLSDLVGSYAVPTCASGSATKSGAQETGSTTPKPSGDEKPSGTDAAAATSGTATGTAAPEQHTGAAPRLVAAAGAVVGLAGFIAVL
jgi:hypothetical protein